MNVSKSVVTQRFFSWMDQVLSQLMPHATVAFHFNLYEDLTSVHVQLIGTSSFDSGGLAETGYWPGEETFTTGEDVFEIPFSVAGSNWQEWLETSRDLVSQYIDGGGKANVLRSSAGVGIGFVDGDMYVLWRSGDA